MARSGPHYPQGRTDIWRPYVCIDIVAFERTGQLDLSGDIHHSLRVSNSLQ